MKTLTPRRLTAAVTAAALGTMLGAATGAFARDDDDKGNDFSARLSGFNEVHFSGGPPATLRGAVSTKASGSFRLKIDEPLRTHPLRADLSGPRRRRDAGAHPLRPAPYGRRHHGLALPDRGQPGARSRDLTPTLPVPGFGHRDGHDLPRPRSSRRPARASTPEISTRWSGRYAPAPPTRTCTPRCSRRARSAARSAKAAGTAKASSGNRGYELRGFRKRGKARREPGFILSLFHKGGG